MKYNRFAGAIFILSIVLALSGFMPSAFPQGSSFDTALLLQKGVYHYTLAVGQDHYFKVQIQAHEPLLVTLLPPAGADYDLYLYTPDRALFNSGTSSELGGFDWVGAGDPDDIAGGTYYIKVDHFAGVSGSYELVVGPVPITSGVLSLTIVEDGRAWYQFNGQVGWAVEINMTQPPDTDIDVGLLDPNGELIASSTKRAGAVEHIFATLTKTGIYVIPIVHYSGPGGDYELRVSVGPKVTLKISGLPSSLHTTVRLGTRLTRDVQGGASVDLIVLDGQLEDITTSSDVQQTTQTRYHCHAPTWYPSTSYHEFTYVTQYLLETDNGGHGTVSPASGWYDSGSSVEVSVSPTTVLSGTDTKFVFQRWDGASTSSFDKVTIVMDSPKTITAVWKTQYHLKVESEYGTPTGEGWYDSGTNAQISVEESVGFIPVRYVFDRWTGAGVSNPSSRSTTVEMSAPRTATAVWREDYIYTIVAAAGVLVVVGAAVFFVMRRKPSAPTPTYTPPPPPPA